MVGAIRNGGSEAIVMHIDDQDMLPRGSWGKTGRSADISGYYGLNKFESSCGPSLGITEKYHEKTGEFPQITGNMSKLFVLLLVTPICLHSLNPKDNEFTII